MPKKNTLLNSRNKNTEILSAELKKFESDEIYPSNTQCTLPNPPT